MGMIIYPLCYVEDPAPADPEDFMWERFIDNCLEVAEVQGPTGNFLETVISDFRSSSVAIVIVGTPTFKFLDEEIYVSKSVPSDAFMVIHGSWGCGYQLTKNSTMCYSPFLMLSETGHVNLFFKNMYGN